MIERYKRNIFSHGFVRVVDTMGSDSAIVQAARVSYGEGTKTVREDTALIDYLMKHRHTTPFEMCEAKFHIKCPIFVARQWIRHRTANINEYSGRYSKMPNEFYMPAVDEMTKQDSTNKQGSTAEQMNHADLNWEMMKGTQERSFLSYETLLQDGLSREKARMLLPLSTYTEFYWKIDLHNLLRFLHHRTDPHAQAEIVAFAVAIEDFVRTWVPAAYTAWAVHVRDAVTLTPAMVEAIRIVTRGAVDNPEDLFNTDGIPSLDMPQKDKDEIWNRFFA